MLSKYEYRRQLWQRYLTIYSFEEIGNFIKRTSLGEFPQLFFALKGAFSSVRTRPPTIDEYVRYQYHHCARMANKPGIIGMWQDNGRSEITDFEEVVRLDTEYITN